MSQTATALSKLNIEDEQLKTNLRKLHLSHQHSFLPWRHLSSAHLQQLASESPSERRRSIVSILRLNERFPLGEVEVYDRERKLTTPPSLRDPNATRIEILIDFTNSLLGFCWGSHLDALKTSTFFSILYEVHQRVSEVVGPQPSVADAWKLFEALLLKHSIERPPFSIACFSSVDVSLLSQWALRTYFQQLKFYQYVFGTTNELELRVTNSSAESVDPTLIGVEVFTDVTDARSVAARETVARPFDLDNARNYFQHSAAESKNLQERALKHVALQQPGGGGGRPLETPIDDNEFRDDETGAEFLMAQLRLTQATLSGQATDSVAASGLLSDPRDQALFDRAIQREMNSLHREFQKEIAKQQENFNQKLGEIEHQLNPNAATGVNPGNVSARSNVATADKRSAMKSRGGK